MKYPYKIQTDDKEAIRYVCEFVHWKSETGKNPCDFCGNNQVRWYCEFLVTGYCEECMVEQLKEYEVS